ncbi:MAG: hypothetical protein JWP81_5297 [Ferruginibacter sp.]|nr:hypothetical protein [Ferruginibacter sp.]
MSDLCLKQIINYRFCLEKVNFDKKFCFGRIVPFASKLPMQIFFERQYE